jgi:hypothetical protein
VGLVNSHMQAFYFEVVGGRQRIFEAVGVDMAQIFELTHNSRSLECPKEWYEAGSVNSHIQAFYFAFSRYYG